MHHVLALAVSTAGTTEQTGIAGVILAVTALVGACATALGTLRGNRKADKALTAAAKAEDRAVAAEDRAASALAWADRLANAHADGVVLVLSYPDTVKPCRALLDANGWRLAYYEVTQAELDSGALLPGPHVIDDVRVADAIVIEGLDPTRMAELAAVRSFRDNIRSGASVAMYTGGLNHRYDLTLWGMCDQGVTTPATTEQAVRGSLARREATSRVQGVRPGQLAAARNKLVG